MRKILLSLLLAPIAGTQVRAQIEVLPPPSFIDTANYYQFVPMAINSAGSIAGTLSAVITPVNCLPPSLYVGPVLSTNGPFTLVKGQTLYPEGVCNATGGTSAIDTHGRIVVQGYACNGLMSSDGSCLTITYNDGTYSGGPSGISNNGIYLVGVAQADSGSGGPLPIFVVWRWNGAKSGYQVIGAGYVPFPGGYQFQSLGNCTTPAFINNQGQFVVSVTDLSGAPHAVVYSAANGAFTMVADLGPNTNGCAMNNSGQIAGVNYATGAGFVYDLNTRSFDNFTVNGETPFPTGINDGGQVVSFAASGDISGSIHTYIRSRTGLCVTDIGTLPSVNPPPQLVYGYAINNAGVVVGAETDPFQPYPPGPVWRGFRYRPTTACGDEH